MSKRQVNMNMSDLVNVSVARMSVNDEVFMPRGECVEMGMNECWTDHASGGDGCVAVPVSAVHVRPCAAAVVPLLLLSKTKKKCFNNFSPVNITIL